MKERLLWAVFVVLAACAVAAVVGLFLKRASPLPRVPDFRVIERSGKPLTRRDLLGEVWIADFVFARCPTACPVMNSVAFDLRKKYPAIKVVTFTVDPSHDTPEYLARWVKDMGLDQKEWYWGSGLTEEGMQQVAAGFLQSAGRVQGKVVHSERFAVVDRYGRIRGIFPVLDPETYLKDTGAITPLEEEIRKVLAERAIPVTRLPKLNAILNGTSAALLLAGLGLVKARRLGAHKAAMLGALVVSTLFLASYLTAHYYLGSTKYTGEGPMRTVYFAILLSHTILAALIVPLAGVTVYRAFQGTFDRHKAVARWTLPLWLYVSVTGVVIYFMLYGGGI